MTTRYALTVALLSTRHFSISELFFALLAIAIFLTTTFDQSENMDIFDVSTWKKSEQAIILFLMYNSYAVQ
ncbi:hypothetical protein L596_027192 [Steinernema carpocapsae]|uniref:Uncharacterized protein n=1 Tax=Steinernema carpocapsae TaxID=34508 RepID=A0A4U5M3R2_STECR|nr:hypothetical protein L596_027192 [Steinernema carpocapsae]